YLPAPPPAGARLLLHARFAGDAERDAASAARAILFTAPSRLVATAAASAPRGDRLAVSGRLSDPAGPLADQVILVTDDAGHALGQSLTDADGRFTVDAATRSLPAGAAHLEARYDPPVSF